MPDFDICKIVGLVGDPGPRGYMVDDHGVVWDLELGCVADPLGRPELRGQHKCSIGDDGRLVFEL